MNKFKKLTSILITLILLLIINTNTSNANMSQVQKYYEKVFDTWGINVQKTDNENTQDQTLGSIIQELSSQNISSAEIVIENDTQLIEDETSNQADITDQQNETNLQNNIDQITIKTKNNLQYILVKNYSSDLIANGQKLSLGFTDFNNQDQFGYYYEDSQSGIKQYYFLEEFFYIPQYREFISEYIKALDKSNKNTITKLAEEIDRDEDAQDFGEIFINKFLIETSIYLFFILVLVALFYNLIVNRNKSSTQNNNQLKLLINYFNTFNNFLIKIRPLLTLLLLILTIGGFVMLGLIQSVYQKDIQQIFISFTTKLSSFDSFNNFVVNQTKLFLLSSTVAVFYLFILFLVTLPSFIKIFKVSLIKFNQIQIKPSAISKLLITLIVFAGFTIPFTGQKSYVFLLALTFFIFLISIKFKDYFYKDSYLTKKQKYLSLVAFLFVTMMGYSVSIYFQTKEVSITDTIFNNEAKVIFYPYAQQIEPNTNTVTQQNDISGLFPIFADNYMIYHPDYSVIFNQNFDNLPQKGQNRNFILVPSRSDTKNLKEIYNNSLLQTYFANNEMFNSVYLKNTNYDDKYILKIVINCSNRDIRNTDLKTKSISDSDEVQEKRVFFYPGCRSDQNESYEIPLFMSFKENALIKLTGFELRDINSFSIENSNELLLDNLQNIQNNLDSTYLLIDETVREISLNQNGEPLYAYSIEKIKPVDFENTISDQIDISENINKLLSLEAISNNFIFWSSQVNAYIWNLLQDEN